LAFVQPAGAMGNVMTTHGALTAPGSGPHNRARSGVLGRGKSQAQTLRQPSMAEPVNLNRLVPA
jgi:hypothetical protein